MNYVLQVFIFIFITYGCCMIEAAMAKRGTERAPTPSHATPQKVAPPIWVGYPTHIAAKRGGS